MNITHNVLLRHFASTMLLSSISLLSAQTISFGSNETIELASGWVAIAQPSGFTAAEQASILQRVNAKLQAAGINLNATAGPSGPCRIIISDSQAPPVIGVQGNETDVGDGTGGPAIVFMAEHPNVPNYQHVDDIANSIKALIAAKHGAGANYQSTANAMTQIQGNARFTDLPYGGNSASQMQFNAGIMNAMTEKSLRPTDVRYRVDTTPGRRLPSLDVELTYSPGLQAGSLFGHLRTDGTFVTFGQAGFLPVAPASFFFDGSGVDFAIRLSNGAVHSLSNGTGRPMLLHANASNPDVFDRVDVQFDVNGDGIPDATVHVQVEGSGGGGFYTRYYPGTDEDLTINGSVNINASYLTSQRAQTANAGDIFYSRVRSSEGQFAGAPALLVAEAFVAASPVVAMPLPGVQVSTGYILLQAGTVGPAGMLGNLPIPAGWAGYHLLLQGFAISSFAGNGLYGATDAMTLTFL